MYERGKLVLVPFPFTDLSSQKIRPALIVSDSKQMDRNVILLFVSSKSYPLSKRRVRIKTTDYFFPQTGLKVTSTIHCDKIATLEKTIVLGEIGLLTSNVMKKISIALRSVMHL